MRTAPNIDVAACGERGHKLRFSWSLKFTTCAACLERRAGAKTEIERVAYGKRASKVTAAMRAAKAENLLDRDGRRG
jgi:hypothetical protein